MPEVLTVAYKTRSKFLSDPWQGLFSQETHSLSLLISAETFPGPQILAFWRLARANESRDHWYEGEKGLWQRGNPIASSSQTLVAGQKVEGGQKPWVQSNQAEELPDDQVSPSWLPPLCTQRWKHIGFEDPWVHSQLY